jgi:hypothetical protein
VLRLALVRLLLVAGLIAAADAVAVVSPASVEPARSGTSRLSDQSSAADDDRRWNPQVDPAAATVESSWTSRSMPAVAGTTPGFRSVLIAAAPGALRPRPAVAQAHLRHTPLLI